MYPLIPYIVCLYSSSEWDRFIAIKVLSARATKENRAGIHHELEFLQIVTGDRILGGPPSLPSLKNHFEITGPHGDHICFVVKLVGSSIDDFRLSTPTKSLRLHVAQLVLYEVAEALRVLHAAGIIHTGERPNRVL